MFRFHACLLCEEKKKEDLNSQIQYFDTFFISMEFTVL